MSKKEWEWTAAALDEGKAVLRKTAKGAVLDLGRKSFCGGTTRTVYVPISPITLRALRRHRPDLTEPLL